MGVWPLHSVGFVPSPPCKRGDMQPSMCLPTALPTSENVATLMATASEDTVCC